MDDKYQNKPVRVGDKSIIDTAIELGYTSTDLRSINNVRKHLQLPNFRGVVCRPRPHGLLWEARRAGGSSLGCYTSELQAAKALARVLGVPVSRLRRKSVLTRRLVRQLFIAAYQVFEKYTPGDYQQTCEQERTCRAALQQDRLSKILLLNQTFIA